jgi:hypothetical protein
VTYQHTFIGEINNPIENYFRYHQYASLFKKKVQATDRSFSSELNTALNDHITLNIINKAVIFAK